jgi:hypothetical protein
MFHANLRTSVLLFRCMQMNHIGRKNIADGAETEVSTAMSLDSDSNQVSNVRVELEPTLCDGDQKPVPIALCPCAARVPLE